MRRIVFAVAVVLILLPAWASDPGELLEGTTAYPIEVVCASTDQLCEPPFVVDLNIDIGEGLKAKYTVPEATGCSSWRVYFYLDGVLKYTSPFLGWYTNPEFGPLDTGFVDLGRTRPEFRGKRKMA